MSPNTITQIKRFIPTEETGRTLNQKNMGTKNLSDWNHLQNVLNTNFKRITPSKIKTLTTNHLLDNYIK